MRRDIDPEAMYHSSTETVVKNMTFIYAIRSVLYDVTFSTKTRINALCRRPFRHGVSWSEMPCRCRCLQAWYASSTCQAESVAGMATWVLDPHFYYTFEYTFPSQHGHKIYIKMLWQTKVLSLRNLTCDVWVISSRLWLIVIISQGVLARGQASPTTIWCLTNPTLWDCTAVEPKVRGCLRSRWKRHSRRQTCLEHSPSVLVLSVAVVSEITGRRCTKINWQSRVSLWTTLWGVYKCTRACNTTLAKARISGNVMPMSAYCCIRSSSAFINPLRGVGRCYGRIVASTA